MIREKKSEEVPLSLSATARYDGEDVKRQLLEDQHEKCYICGIMKTVGFFSIMAGCLLAAGPFSARGQETPPELVIRIDDMGAFHSVNEACVETFRSGIARSVEVMPVAAWFPEAVKMLKENPGLDVGVHLTLTSEWENVKWRPLTHCPSLTDADGYFYPMIRPNPDYPGQALTEHEWDIREIENEFRAQIETALRNIPQVSHLTGHMASTAFNKEVNELTLRLAREYNLACIDRMDSDKEYGFRYIGYTGANRTALDKKASFIASLEKLEPGKRYLFLDHPAYDNDEMKTVFHIGYENAAEDRQGVTEMLTSPEVKQAVEDLGIRLIDINVLTRSLPREAASPKLDKAVRKYLAAVQKAGQDRIAIYRLRRKLRHKKNTPPLREQAAGYRNLQSGGKSPEKSHQFTRTALMTF